VNDGPLALLAVSAKDSQGRIHDETETALSFSLDRRRVLHSSAFRRLEYKTQVFLTQIDDHLRTRLTHTLEVAEIARTLARALGVNEDLAEVIALAHDLGHPPFGHAGEEALSALMAEHGGFEHNLHTLRVVDELEHPYPPFRGLNLSFEVREGLGKHTTVHDKPQANSIEDDALRALFEAGPSPTVEAQIVCVADRIAYDIHDIEDAIGSDLLDEGTLSTLPLWIEASNPVHERFGNRPIASVRRPILDNLRDILLEDCIEESTRRHRAFDFRSVEDVRRSAQPVVSLSSGDDDSAGRNMEAELADVEKVLFNCVYKHPRLVQMDSNARQIIRDLFGAFIDEPKLMPARYERRINTQGLYRVVCDYIAGMTDRFCRQQRENLCGPDINSQ
jgi:dGTPase